MGTSNVPSSAGGWTVPGFTEWRELGRGPSGRVAAAVHDGSGHRVAIKYLSPALVGDPAFIRRFRTETRALRELRVPQVVRVHDFVEQPGLGAAVITELVDGVSLREMTERSGPAHPEAALTVLKGTLLALAAAHARGIGHQDCKPENVLADTVGNSRLTDFGWAVRNGARPPAGMPPYLAPELRDGAGETPASDIYAATAVFFYCLAGEPPFTGTGARLREQHATAAVPAQLVDPPLRRLIVRGLAKDPALRPPSTLAFAAELDALAASVYGPGWEERGRGQLAERVTAILPLKPRAGHRGPRGRLLASARAAAGGGRSRAVAVAAVAAAAVVAIGGVAAAVTLKDKGHGHTTASLSGTSSPGMSAAPSFSAVADVSPPVAASKCATPTTFTYSGTLSATVPGTVTYRWVYSAGKPGPEQTVSFTAAGERRVAGETVRTKTAGGGWGKIEVTSPVARTSNVAVYKLLCGGGTVGGVTATAAVTPAARTVSCVTALPAFTTTGSIKAAKAGTVTYYWARSDGANSAPATLTFTGPGAKAVQPLTITPPRASGSGQAVLVVTSPVTTASSPAAYTLTCKAPTTPTTNPTAPPAANPAPPTTNPPAAHPTASPTTSPMATATAPASPKSSPSGSNVSVPNMTLTVNLPTTAFVGQPYSGTAISTGGDGTYNWSVIGLPTGLIYTANGGTLTVSGTPTAPVDFDNVDIHVSDGESPSAMLVWELNIPVGWQPITLTSNMPLTATVGQPYLGTVTASGGAGSAFTWGFTLPQGLTATVNGTTVTISGTPTTVNTDAHGNFLSTSVTVSNGHVNAAQSFSVIVGPAS